MGHALAGQLASDVLSDFPANAVLQRVGLIESIMNTLLSVTSYDSEGKRLCRVLLYLFK